MALVHAGIDPTVIALWMGHASVASTKPYINSRELHQMDAFAQVAC